MAQLRAISIVSAVALLPESRRFAVEYDSWGTDPDSVLRIWSVWGRVRMSFFVLFALPRYLHPFRCHLQRALSVVLASSLALPVWGKTLTGRITHVRDVDTIVVDHTAIRLNGVDGPETDTLAGRDARLWMIGYLEGKTLTCALNGQRSYDRLIGVCYADGQDIGAAAVSAGHALDCPRFSDGRYRVFETEHAIAHLSRSSYC